jgi:hypothetical protein
MGISDPHIDPYGYPRGVILVRPLVRFSAINVGLSLFFKQAGTWILTGLLVLAGNFLLNFVWAALFDNHRPGLGFGVGFGVSGPESLVAFLTSAVLNGFFLGGMFGMACRQTRGEQIRAGQIFDVRYRAKEVFLASVLYGLFVFVGGLCVLIPGFIAAGVLMFTFPLVMDGHYTATQAVGASWEALKGQWFRATVFHFVLNILAGLGMCCALAGLLFTMPLYVLSIAVLYREFFDDRSFVAPGLKPAGLGPDL